jgi:hypothetical protein
LNSITRVTGWHRPTIPATLRPFPGDGVDGKRGLCRSVGAEPCVGECHQLHGSGLGRRRWPMEQANSLLLKNRRIGLGYSQISFTVEALFQAAASF